MLDHIPTSKFLKNAQKIPRILYVQVGMYCITIECGVYPMCWGYVFASCSPGWSSMMSSSRRQSLQFEVRAPPDQTKEPNDVRTLNMTQLESASIWWNLRCERCQEKHRTTMVVCRRFPSDGVWSWAMNEHVTSRGPPDRPTLHLCVFDLKTCSGEADVQNI